ncbi:hypothetical protein [Catenuloplanes japonicus]|uniref:hypothetical protein n=1 Tax=Catenuloplanes japonicus TaxID=33876 RepID=UPI0005250500|nr:hypothetical protein [Catenuloplanes japonicus]
MDADGNSITDPILEESMNRGPDAGDHDRGEALDATVAAYEAAWEYWRGRGDEIAAEQAEVPWETSPDDIIHAHAADAAWRVLEQWYESGGFTSFAQERDYMRDAGQLRRLLEETAPPPIFLDAGEQSPATDSAYGKDEPRRDAGTEASIE